MVYWGGLLGSPPPKAPLRGPAVGGDSKNFSFGLGLECGGGLLIRWFLLSVTFEVIKHSCWSSAGLFRGVFWEVSRGV